MNRKIVRSYLVPGHRVASGGNGDPRFPGGTIRMQIPHFARLGLDLSRFHPGTLNLSVAPLRFEIRQADWTFRALRWHPTEPVEDFSFVECRARPVDGNWTDAFVYHPHPETKPEHFQSADVVEIIARDRIEGLSYGDSLEVEIAGEKIAFLPREGDAIAG